MKDKLSNEKNQMFRHVLLEHRTVLETAIEGEAQSSQTVELDQSKVERLARMAAWQGQAMTQETKHRHEEALRNISAALSRNESGDYGYCLKCNEQIVIERLEVDPAASLCIGCANLAEQA